MRVFLLSFFCLAFLSRSSVLQYLKELCEAAKYCFQFKMCKTLTCLRPFREFMPAMESDPGFNGFPWILEGQLLNIMG